jgi:hypothetical protein
MHKSWVTRLLGLILMWQLVSCNPQPVAAPHQDEANVRRFLERYFSTWSANDMEGYGACFAPEARVTYVEKNGDLLSQGLTDFLHGQKMGHETSKVVMTEVPVTMQISGDMLVAQAAVSWKLTKGSKIETGWDYFTLRKANDGWRIVSLVFYQD